MIIKLTVHDNDFTEGLEWFAKNIWIADVCNWETDLEKAREERVANNRFRELWSKVSNGGTIDADAQAEFLDIVRRKLKYFCETRYSEEAEYLMGQAEVQLLESLTPKWENGENVYVFIHAGGQFITL